MKDDLEVASFGKEYSDEDFLKVFWAAYADSESHFSGWREDIRTFYSIYAGESQLDDADREFAQLTKRPLINLNYSIGTLNAIIGAQMSDRKEVQFKGVGTYDYDGVTADWMTILLRTAYQYSDGHRRESDAALDMLITGYGWSEAYLDTSKVPIHARIGPAQPWEMYPDPNAVEDNLRDARFHIRVKQWELEEAEARWPDSKEEMRTGLAADTVESVTQIHGVYEGFSNAFRPRIKVYEYQYLRYVPWSVFVDPTTGKQVEMKRSKANKVINGLRSQGLEVEQRYDYAKKVYYRAYITGNATKASGVILEKKELSLNRFTYSCVTGFKNKDPDDGRVIYFGPMTIISDIQIYLNKAFAVYMEIMARGAKGGGMIEEDALSGSPEEFEVQASRAGGWIRVAEGAISGGKIKERGTQAIPQGHERFMDHLTNAFSTLTGVTEFVKGTAQNERSNVLVSNLQQQSYTMLNPLFDPITAFIIDSGKVLTEIILKHYTDEQINRILADQRVEGLTFDKQVNPETGEEEEVDLQSHAEILRAVRLDDFEVTADVGQATVTQKQAVWQILVQTNLIGTLLENGVDISGILPELIRFMPLPESLALKLSEDLKESMKVQKLTQTAEGIIQTLAEMAPEDAMQIVQQAADAVQAQQPQQPQPPPQPQQPPPM